MSTPFYDLASLVFLPSGYKSGKLYAQKPLTTDGQLAFTRASTATRVNASGLVEAVASGVPRLDYLNSTCPKLLLEPQRTNLVAYSEQFDNVYWTKQAGTVVTANQTISPDGTQNADLIVGTGNGIFISALTVPSASPNTKSVYLKGVSGGEVVILQDPTQTVNNTICNLTTSWQRFTLTETQTGGAGGLWIAGIQAGGIYAWGAQLEAGAYATSYIPTTTAAVTRLADTISKTGISSLIGQTEGTIFWDLQVNSLATNNEGILYLDNGSGFGNNIWIYKAPTALDGSIYVGGAVQASFTKNNISTGHYKCALAYGNNNSAFFVNGVQVGSTDTSCSVPTMNRLVMGSTPVSQDTSLTNQVLVFKTRLTNAQLAELTA
jgi:hypothetical protein